MKGWQVGLLVGGSALVIGGAGFAIYKASQGPTTAQHTYTQVPTAGLSHTQGGVPTTQTAVATGGADTWVKDVVAIGGLVIQGYQAYNS